MVDRPIIFSAPMVRALLDGRKTQTRRLLKPQPETFLVDGQECEVTALHIQGDKLPRVAVGRCITTQEVPNAVNDRLYVREAWSHSADGVFEVSQARLMGRGGVIYRADEDVRYPHAKFWPSIYMPREFSRLTLVVEEIRIERLQAMEGQHPGESDAIAEGVRRIHHGDGDYYYHATRDEPHPQNWSDPTDAFRDLWNSLHGAGAWDANPWVLALTFRVIRGNIDRVPAC